MKKLTILAFMAFVFGCDTNSIDQADQQQLITNPDNRAPAVVSPPPRSRNQVVIQFNKDIPIASRVGVRRHYDVIKYEQCECADKNLELWTIGGSQINLENLLGEIGSDPDLEGGDYQYYMDLDAQNLYGSQPAINDQIAKINTTGNRGVTIAVIDSGVDYNYPLFNSKFLYDNDGNENNCDGDVSGWDFVNHDNNIFDDNGHGTMVTYLIYKKLMATRTRFNILPVKAFSGRGKTDTFKVSCAFQYAATNKNVDIINMSFGWYYAKLTLLSKFMDENSDKLLVASAGNAGINVDIIAHYPSSYNHSNLITVAGLDANFVAVDPMSNFGNQSIDIAAPGRDIPFDINGQQAPVTGTSFSNAFVTANAAILYDSAQTSVDWVATICNEAIPDADLLYKVRCGMKLID